MAEDIDIEKAVGSVEELSAKLGIDGDIIPVETICNYLRQLPVVKDVQPRAVWKRSSLAGRIYCSNCTKSPFMANKTPYCPNCGAQMDEESEEKRV